MKRLYKTAMLALMSNMALAQSFFVPTTYRGAFEPAPAAMWTDNWTNWDPQNTIYPSPTVTVSSNITVNTTWTSGNVYLLQGQIFVKTGATLTIQPGTIILGDKASTGAGLFITKGSKIIAQGTPSQPIVFTSNQAPGARAIGDWGGLILMGQGSNNQPGGIANIEGFAASPDTEFGGGPSADDADNSGILQYVRIEWGGYVYAPNKEINGLTFGSVGSGTTVDHVQVSFANDDGFEWFGGAVNCRYLVSYRNLDDDFDADFGYKGKVQFALSVRDPNLADNPSVSTSEGFETDNDASGSTATPQTNGIFSNVTLIGPFRGNTAAAIASGYRRGARIRRNSALRIYNSIFMDFPRGVHIDGALSEANATSGNLKFMNNIIAGTSINRVTEVNAGSSFNITSWFGANMNDSLMTTSGILTTPYDFLNPDYRPAASSVALMNSGFSDVVIAPFVLTAPIATTSIEYCEGATTAILSATATSGNTLRWYTVPTGGSFTTTAPTPSAASAGTFQYYVSQANSEGYEGPRTMITVIVYPNPATPIISADGPTSFCTGGSVVLTSSATSGNMWSTTESTTSITVTSTGSYSVTHTDANGCSATSAATNVNVSSAPLPTVSVSGSTALCMGETVTLTASPADSYNWSPGGQTTQTIVVSSAGTYNVTTTNSNACDGVGTSASTTVTVNAVPVAAGSVASVTGSVVTFTNSSTGATSYNWNFGDASNSTAAAPTHAYATNGSYTVTLIATNAAGCSDTTTFNVSITVGVEEMENISEVKVYPNPFANETTIEVNAATSEELSYQIFDLTGKMFKAQSGISIAAGKNLITVDATEMATGIYFMQISTQHYRKVVKLVINK
jgi:PKD repeat protein